MMETTELVYASLAIVVMIYVVRWRTSPLYCIPTVGGPSVPGFSYLAVFNLFLHGNDIIEEGYRKFHGSVFKIALPHRWMVVVSGSTLIEDIRKRSDDELSPIEGAEELVLMKYTFPQDAFANPYHIDVIKENLNRSLSTILSGLTEELKLAVREHIPTKGDEWVSLSMAQAMNVVTRVSNRAFVGLPLCRNKEYLELSRRYTLDVAQDTKMLTVTPQLLRPMVGYMFSAANRTTAQAMPLLQSIVDERKAKMTAYGEQCADTQKDLLHWVLERAIRCNTSMYGLAVRILFLNFVSVHSTSNALMQTLYHLAVSPAYVQALREEIEPILASEGWTKLAMSNMRKLDSFLKESQRLHGTTIVAMTRKAMKDLTLIDGTYIPKGTILTAAQRSTHLDDRNHADAHVFDPFRYARMREVKGEETKHQFVNTSADYMVFGHGRHACPGRFFAANELKAILAYIVLHYDLKLEGDGPKHPPNKFFALSIFTAVDGQVMLRERRR